MGKKAGIVCMILGAVLMGSALLLFLSNERIDQQAGATSQQALEELRQLQTTPTTATVESKPEKSKEETLTETTQSEKLTIVTVNGYDYIGTLTIPVLELELPIQSDWSEEKLEISPCRHFGSPQNDDFVIAAHNYVNHFAYLYKLNPGDLVSFKDMNGWMTEYAVDHLESLNPTDVDAVQNSGYDLVLYTCTYGSEGRWVVFCNRTQDGT